MEQIGKDAPSPKLKDVLPKNIEKFFKEVVNSTKKLYQSGLVHGDLSEYNILNYRDKPVFIDFSQGTQVDNPNAHELIVRDVKNLCRFFGKFVKVDPEAILNEITKK